MRLLFITALYPPFDIGGWGQLVEEINVRLQQRGHSTLVITSKDKGYTGPKEPGVERVLTLEADLNHYKPLSLFSHRRRLRHNLEATRSAIAGFKPDVVFVHVMWNLSRGIPWQAEQMCPHKVIYYMADHWPCSPDVHEQYWRDKARTPLAAAAKRALAFPALAFIRRCNRRFVLNFEHVLCVSNAILTELHSAAGIQSKKLHLVSNGIDTAEFRPAERSRPFNGRRVSLLYAGSLGEHKGVHTAVEALGLLQSRGSAEGLHLTILGSGHFDYEKRLRRITEDLGLVAKVRFLNQVSRNSMPDLLRGFDILVFPSIWEEPMARIVQEAMASGLVVVGTTTGGTGELLIEGKTGLTFPAGSAEALAERIEELKQRPDLFSMLSKSAQDAVRARFDIRTMIDEVEDHLRARCGIPMGAAGNGAARGENPC